MEEHKFDHEKIEALRNRLTENLEWPTLYFYKFIVPNNNEKLAKVFALFDDTSNISKRESSGGKFVSVSAKEVASSADVVIEKYILASKIDGLISL